MIDLFCAQDVVVRKYTLWPKKEIDIDNAGDIPEEEIIVFGVV